MSDRTDREAARATEAIADQLWLLRAVMLDYLGPDFGTESEDAALGYSYDPRTGETVVGIALDDLTYSLANGELIVQRERGGRIEWARVSRTGRRSGGGPLRRHRAWRR